MVQIHVLLQEMDGNVVFLIFMIWNTKKWIILQTV